MTDLPPCRYRHDIEYRYRDDSGKLVCRRCKELQEERRRDARRTQCPKGHKAESRFVNARGHVRCHECDNSPRLKRICKRGHDTHVVGRYGNGGCKACGRVRERTPASTEAKKRVAPNRHTRENPIAQAIPNWVPNSADQMVPCNLRTGWHALPFVEQIEVCQGCPLKAQCLETGRSITAAGEVWGGVLIGTPDKEQPQQVAA